MWDSVLGYGQFWGTGPVGIVWRYGASRFWCRSMTPTRAAGSFDVAMIRVRPADQHHRVGALVVDPAGAGSSGLDYLPVWASWSQDTLLTRSVTASLGGHTAPRRSPRVAQQVAPYLVEVRVAGGYAC